MSELREQRGPTPTELWNAPDWSTGEFDDEGNNYFAVPIAGLRMDSVIVCDLYVKTAPRKFVKYRDKDESITLSILNRLHEFNHENIYIPVSMREQYDQYIEKMLPSLLNDPKIPVTQKAQLVYHTSASVIQDMLESPRTGNIERVEFVIDSVIDSVLVGGKLLGTMLSLASYDYYTYTHCVHVSVFAVALARRVKHIGPADMRTIAMGAIFHDIGKSFLPPDILLKPRSLTAEEFATIREHPSLGANILLNEKKQLEEVATLVKHHHERLDGSGYPDGLNEKQLHPFSGIITATDIYDALTTRRTYRGAFAPMQALKIMSEHNGTAVSNDIFRELVKMLGTIGPA